MLHFHKRRLLQRYRGKGFYAIQVDGYVLPTEDQDTSWAVLR
jgi:hypothetical protein